MDQESKSEQAGFRVETVPSGENNTSSTERLEASLKELKAAGLSLEQIGAIATGKTPEAAKQQGSNLANQVESVMRQAISAGMSDRQINSLITTSLSPQGALSVADRLEGALALAYAIQMPANQIAEPLDKITNTLSANPTPPSRGNNALDRLRGSLRQLEDSGLSRSKIRDIATGKDSSAQNPGQPEAAAPSTSVSTPAK